MTLRTLLRCLCVGATCIATSPDGKSFIILQGNTNHPFIIPLGPKPEPIPPFPQITRDRRK